jgi:hypothetical protein
VGADSFYKEQKMSEQTVSRTDPSTRLAHQAQNDDAFRRQLLADPKAVLEKEGAQNLYLVLPLARRAGSQQLSDAELVSLDEWPPPCMDCVGPGCYESR